MSNHTRTKRPCETASFQYWSKMRLPSE
jgi:hypothetical protein